MKIKFRFKWRILFVSAVLIAVAIVITLTGIGVKNEIDSTANGQSAASNNDTTDNATQLDEKYRNNPELIAADLYAEHFGVTEEEALRRFDVSDALGDAEMLLETNEAATFGGLWIQHEPVFCVVVAFTRGGEEAIKKYISANLTQYVQLRTVKYTLSELGDVQRKVGTALRDLGIPFDGAIYVQENVVEFQVTNRIGIDKAIEEGKLIIPECVRIKVVAGLATPE